MAPRPKQTLMDFMVIAISPALIMGMVGSLLFFLLTVFYQGQHGARLDFIFAMFTLAIVLIARISMEQGTEYASMFGIPLAIVTGLAMMRFVEFRGPLAPYSLMINLGLISLVWWSAHKLTWDCTFIDDSQDASGEGLLQGMGFDAETVERQAEVAPAAAGTSSSARDQEADAAAGPQSGPEWYRRMVRRRRRPHTPGVWVIYYALAALPLFIVGESLLKAGDVSSRHRAFRLLCVYVGCALGLLLTTSFLGLRRYLRQRHVRMPVEIAGLWLGLGTALVLALLLVCLVLPRPGASLPISQLPFIVGSPDDLSTQRWAPGNDGPKRPDEATRTRPDDQAAKIQPGQQSAPDAPLQPGKANQQAAEPAEPQSPRESSQPKTRTNGRSPDRSQPEPQQSEPTHQPPMRQPPQQPPQEQSQQPPQEQSQQPSQEQSQQPSQEQSQQPSQEQSQQPSQQQQQQQQKASPQRAEDERKQQASQPHQPVPQEEPRQRPQDNSPQPRKQQQPENEAKQSEPRSEPPNDSAPSSHPSPQREAPKKGASKPPPGGQNATRPARQEPAAREKEPASPERRDTAPSPRRFDPSQLTRVLPRVASGLGNFLKLVFLAVLVAALLVAAWKYRSEIHTALAQLMADLLRLWASLWGGRPSAENAAESSPGPPTGPPLPTFASFADPFATGRAERYSTEQLVQYSFEALEAWGRDHGCPRGSEQTPLEFARDLSAIHTSLARETQVLAELFSRMVYGRERIATRWRDDLRRLWQQLRAATR